MQAKNSAAKLISFFAVNWS